MAWTLGVGVFLAWLVEIPRLLWEIQLLIFEWGLLQIILWFLWLGLSVVTIPVLAGIRFSFGREAIWLFWKVLLIWGRGILHLDYGHWRVLSLLVFIVVPGPIEHQLVFVIETWLLHVIIIVVFIPGLERWRASRYPVPILGGVWTLFGVLLIMVVLIWLSEALFPALLIRCSWVVFLLMVLPVLAVCIRYQLHLTCSSYFSMGITWRQL